VRAEPVHNAGFTLVEVLVALVVSSLLLAIIFDGSATGRRRAKTSQETRRALLLADDLLARAAAEPMGTASAQGTSGKLKWSVDEMVVSRDPRNLTALVEVRTAIVDDEGHRLFEGALRRLKTVPQQ